MNSPLILFYALKFRPIRANQDYWSWDSYSCLFWILNFWFW
jgi:hypothetical protein